MQAREDSSRKADRDPQAMEISQSSLLEKNLISDLENVIAPAVCYHCSVTLRELESDRLTWEAI